MTYLRRLATLLPFSLPFIASAISGAQQLPPIAQQMAKTYGLDSFDQVEAIRYTFSATGIPRPPGFIPSRRWEWRPKTDTVTYEGTDKEGKPVRVTYQRSELGSQSDTVKNEIDPAFFNDQFWLLLPLHVVWDRANVTDAGTGETPLGKTPAERIVVKYAAEGYSPGDTWEFYVGADKRVEEIRYHRAVPVPGYSDVVITKFAVHEKAGPLLISTDHTGTADGKPFRVSFSDVAVKLVGSDKWVTAQAATERIARK